jgi:hypothetical protein
MNRAELRCRGALVRLRLHEFCGEVGDAGFGRRQLARHLARQLRLRLDHLDEVVLILDQLRFQRLVWRSTSAAVADFR